MHRRGLLLFAWKVTFSLVVYKIGDAQDKIDPRTQSDVGENVSIYSDLFCIFFLIPPDLEWVK